MLSENDNVVLCNHRDFHDGHPTGSIEGNPQVDGGWMVLEVDGGDIYLLIGVLVLLPKLQ